MIYYLEASSPVLPSLVPLAHFTLVALLLLLPLGAFVSPVSPVSFSVSFLESWIALFLSTRNNTWSSCNNSRMTAGAFGPMTVPTWIENKTG